MMLLVSLSCIWFQLPVEQSQKHSIFQRVQRLRSARPLISSTTDSDSDVPTKTPPRRESPRIRKRESPKTRKKDSPALRKKESPSLRRKESPKFSHGLELTVPERSTDRREEHVKTVSSNVISEKKLKPEKLAFSTVTLPTAKMTLPKDISPHEMNGVPRKGSGKEKPGLPAFSPITEVAEIPESREPKLIQVQTTTKGTEPKFPELLIPEWKKQAHGLKTHHLERVPSVDQDDVFDPDVNEVFIPERTRITEQVILSTKLKAEENSKLLVDRSFDSSETSEDTLKYLSPEPSPAHKTEPPKFPLEISAIRKQEPDQIETASDPGQSRPNSMIKVSVETHGTPLLLRKSNFGHQVRGGVSSRINIPVIPLKQIKPAQELLEESQKYRSGHSIYLTRILKRYPMKIECRSRSLEDKQYNKENVRGGYVKQMIKHLSREGTPESKGSPTAFARGLPSQHKSESPKSEFVSQIVRKLSSPATYTTEKALTPLRDLTNGGQVQKLKQTYDSSEGIHERTYSETITRKKGMSEPLDSSSSVSSTRVCTKADLRDSGESVPSKLTYSSMPMLSLEENDSGRERSATTSSPSSRGHSHSPKDSPSQKHKIHVAVSMSPGRSRRIIDPTLSPVRMRKLIDPASPGRRRRIQEPSPIEIVQEEPEAISVAQSQLSPAPIKAKKRSPKIKRKEKSKMGTIEVLCRQSMTFDLGVSVQSREGAKAQGAEARSQTLNVRHSMSSTTSADSDIEAAAAGTSGEKKKSRHKKFLDSAFIQKSKKFFKVSK